MNTLPYNYSSPSLSNLHFPNTTREAMTMQPHFRQISTIADDKTLHKTAVLVIMSILIFISVSISGAVLVFCKKKNSVFIHQSCEKAEKDYEYEMDDINTDRDSSDTVSVENEPIRSQTFPMISDMVSQPIKTPYKFIRKSKTFSGTGNQSLLQVGSSSQLIDSFGFSDSFCSSSSPSLNFHSLTIKVDVEPCKTTSPSSECLHECSKWNDSSNTCDNQHHECLRSYSEERLNGLIPWDTDSSSLEIIPFIDTSVTSDLHDFIIDCEAPNNDENSVSKTSHHYRDNSIPPLTEKHNNEDSNDSDEGIYKPLLSNTDIV